MIHVTHLRSVRSTMLLFFPFFFSTLRIWLRSDKILFLEILFHRKFASSINNLASGSWADTTNYPFVRQSSYPFFSWQEGATIYIDPWPSISLPSIRSRKMNSPLSSGEIWFQRRKRAHTHSCREKEGSSETLSLLLEEPANEPQGFAQRLPGWQIAAGATIARLRSRESWRRVAFRFYSC